MSKETQMESERKLKMVVTEIRVMITAKLVHLH